MIIEGTFGVKLSIAKVVNEFRDKFLRVLVDPFFNAQRLLIGHRTKTSYMVDAAMIRMNKRGKFEK